MLRVFLVAGARPNFMKIAPLYRESLTCAEIDCRIVHTGQHYDYELSQVFFEDLELPRPDFFLNVGSGSHATQTAKVMVSFETLCESEEPDLVVVVGDVNSTLGCSVVAKKLMIEVAHVEAGLRSFDLRMPEEINRMVTDCLSDYLFVTEESGIKNLINEGKTGRKIHFVGNVMIDNLFYQLKKLQLETESSFSTYEIKRAHPEYIFLTLHRPSNVDSRDVFVRMAAAINQIAEDYPIFFPVHPRTQKMIKEFNIRFSPRVIQMPPLGFKESLFLWKDAILVMTDSGGLQEETTALGVPCVTLRENTERPITVEMGTNVLGGTEKQSILRAYSEALARDRSKAKAPPKWDGHAAKRIWRVITGDRGSNRQVGKTSLR